MRLKDQKGKFEKYPKFKDDYVKLMEGVFKDVDADRAAHQPKKEMYGISLTKGYITLENQKKLGLYLTVQPSMMAQLCDLLQRRGDDATQ